MIISFLCLNLDNSFGLDVRRESDYFLPLPVPEAIHNKYFFKKKKCSLQSIYNKEQSLQAYNVFNFLPFNIFAGRPVLTFNVGTEEKNSTKPFLVKSASNKISQKSCPISIVHSLHKIDKTYWACSRNFSSKCPYRGLSKRPNF